MVVQIALTKLTRSLSIEKYASIYLQIEGGNTGKMEEAHTQRTTVVTLM